MEKIKIRHLESSDVPGIAAAFAALGWQKTAKPASSTTRSRSIMAWFYI
ncbi:MAG: hypothetical protein JW862_12505 [Anaerolineales bacterium]|nr:hypothetical protein [Anaerolineales bacterium]